MILLRDSINTSNVKKASVLFQINRKRKIIMPIVLAPTNAELKVIRILTDEKTKKHLESLGITINSQLTVLSSSGGTVVCKVKDGRIALDNTVSTKIFVA